MFPSRRKVGVGSAVMAVWLTQSAAGVSAQPTGQPSADHETIEAQWRVEGITSPSQTADLASVLSARIAGVPVSEGAVVRVGEVVVVLDDKVQSTKTKLAKSAAETTLEVELADARWQHAKREWDRLVALFGDDFASSKELSDARAEFEVTRLEASLARFRRSQANLAYQREQALLDEFRLRAPFSGYVAQHLKHAGETVDPLEGIVSLVQLDPIQVQVDCPLALAPFIHRGHEVRVRPADDRWTTRNGVVTFASQVADAASQTFKVKVSVPNEDGVWLSGLRVTVDFSEGSARNAVNLRRNAEADAAPHDPERGARTEKRTP